jgi:hypothetical protein
MRVSLLLAALLLPAGSLAAQPAPDAPLPQHVSYLIDAAGGGFRGLRGGPTYGPGTTLSTAVLASYHPIRFQGEDARSEVRVNVNWNVMHSTWLPVAGTRAAADSAWDQAAREIAAVIPAGWQTFRNSPDLKHIYWQECQQGRGREVALSRSLPFERPALNLIVYRYDRPCETAAAGGSGASPGKRPGG